MRRSIFSAFLAVAMVASAIAALPVDAQVEGLDITIDPPRGSSGTTVNISGSGAPPHGEVTVGFAPWNLGQECHAPRDGETIETVTADENGNFIATHTAEQFSEDQIGNTYFAYLPDQETPQPMPNLTCFEFGTQYGSDVDLIVDVDPEAGSPDSNVTITGHGAASHEEIVVGHASWEYDQDCRAPRGGETVDVVAADENGEFSATHIAERFSDEHIGYTYFAYVPMDGAPEPMSNLECFAFESTDQARYFDQTGHWVTDRFLEYWNRNGALPIFGFPLSDNSVENGVTIQYFERQRFELHRDNERPFDVLLGHLGTQAAEERGLRDTEPFQPVHDAGQGCLYFEETGHNVCHDFLNYWQSYGLELGYDGVSMRESVMLFGYPISEEFTDPDTGMTVQYFERAKLEHYPDNDAPWDVIPERLGAKLFDR